MLALLTLAAVLQSSPAPAASAAPSASAAPAALAEDPAVTKLARAQYDAFASGKIDASQYSVPIPHSAIAQVQADLSALGPIKNVMFLQAAKLAAGTVYVYEFACQNGAVLEQLSVKDGKINGIYFRPAQ